MRRRQTSRRAARSDAGLENSASRSPSPVATKIPWTSRLQAFVLAFVYASVILFLTFSLASTSRAEGGVDGQLEVLFLPPGALLLGLVFPRQAGVIALAMTVPVVVAFANFSRGDPYGYFWILIFPLFILFGAVILLPLAWLGGRLRRRGIGGRRSDGGSEGAVVGLHRLGQGAGEAGADGGRPRCRPPRPRRRDPQ